MKEYPDDELDKLFRKSAEELDPQYDPGDWNALKKRMDGEDGRTPMWWWRKWWPVGLVLLLLSGGVATYFFTNNPEAKQLNKADQRNYKKLAGAGPDKAIAGKSEAQVGNEVDEKTLDQAVSQQGIQVQAKNDSDNSSEPSAVAAAKVEEKDLKILPRSQSKAGGVYLEPNRSKREGGDGAFSSNRINRSGKAGSGKDRNSFSETRKNLLATINKKNKPVQSENLEGVAGNSAVPISAVEESGQDNIQSAAATERELAAPMDLLATGPWASRQLMVLPGIEAPETPVTSKPVQEREASPKFAIRAGYAPDLSSVGLKNFSKPGAAVSLMAEYLVVPRLYIQAGVVRSVKEYNAKAGEYQWPDKWKGQTVLPDNIEGTCKIIEIPLNLRYDFAQKNRYRFFAGTGVSSYYMQNEKYAYHYTQHSPGIKYSWEGKTGWYFLSHINASVGYEYRLSKKLSLLAEPYARIPVKRVGFGKVNLFTTGVWISVRYTPSFK